MASTSSSSAAISVTAPVTVVDTSDTAIVFCDATAAEEYKCSICLDFYKNPVMLNNENVKKKEHEEPCGHIFCKDCILKALSTNKRCPQCRRFTKKSNLVRLPHKRKELNALKVICKYKEQGCVWLGNYGDYEKHVNEDCVYRSVFCEYKTLGHENCGLIMPFRDYEKHLLSMMSIHLALVNRRHQEDMKNLVALREQYQKAEGKLDKELKLCKKRAISIESSIPHRLSLEVANPVLDLRSKSLTPRSVPGEIRYNLITTTFKVANVLWAICIEAISLSQDEIDIIVFDLAKNDDSIKEDEVGITVKGVRGMNIVSGRSIGNDNTDPDVSCALWRATCSYSDWCCSFAGRDKILVDIVFFDPVHFKTVKREVVI